MYEKCYINKVALPCLVYVKSKLTKSSGNNQHGISYQKLCCGWSVLSRRCHWERRWPGKTGGCRTPGPPGSCVRSRCQTGWTGPCWSGGAEGQTPYKHPHSKQSPPPARGATADQPQSRRGGLSWSGLLKQTLLRDLADSRF